jgi:hypothetical protein
MTQGGADHGEVGRDAAAAGDEHELRRRGGVWAQAVVARGAVNVQARADGERVHEPAAHPAPRHPLDADLDLGHLSPGLGAQAVGPAKALAVDGQRQGEELAGVDADRRAGGLGEGDQRGVGRGPGEGRHHERPRGQGRGGVGPGAAVPGAEHGGAQAEGGAEGGAEVTLEALGGVYEGADEGGAGRRGHGPTLPQVSSGVKRHYTLCPRFGGAAADGLPGRAPGRGAPNAR